MALANVSGNVVCEVIFCEIISQHKLNKNCNNQKKRRKQDNRLVSGVFDFAAKIRYISSCHLLPSLHNGSKGFTKGNTMETVISSTLQDASEQDSTYYPDSDGLPMANNTEHLERITTTKHGLESVFHDRDDVFVAADLFWYPVKGKPRIVLAPDVMVALGRPKGARKSYQQWREDGIAPQVVFEFLSESNTPREMTNKALFFERFGVQEYYLYDMERKHLSGFIRYQEEDDMLEELSDMNDWTSPRLGVRFDMSSGDLQLYKPDGTPFLSYDEYARLEHNLVEERKRANEQAQRAHALAAKLRELGINPDEIS
jgi:Uma2 family endonuclease